MGNPGSSSAARAQRALACAFSAALGVAWFLAAGGGRAVSPTAMDWLGTGDYAGSTAAWLFFRDEPWRWPLGTFAGFAAPLGGSLATADAMPLVGILAKLASPLLPSEVQYFGPWIALSFALQGAAGALLTSLLTPRLLDQVLGGALFVAAPVLLWRVGHVGLTTHWAILLALWLALRPREASVAGAALLAAFIAGIHPYLAGMIVPIVLTIPWTRWRTGALDRARALLDAAVIVALPVAVFAALGYFAVPGGAHGYGYFTADLLTFVNPMTWSALLPTIGVGPGQYEGFAYLGCGTLLLVAWALFAWRRKLVPGVPRELRPALAVVTLLAVFATLPTVRIAGVRILSIANVLAPLRFVTAAFRSSGRFVWPLAYLVLLGAIACAVRTLPRGRSTSVLALALVIQIVDLAPALRVPRFTAVPWRQASASWWLAAGSYDEIALHPAILQDGDGAICTRGPPDPSWIPFAYRAWRVGARVNSGYLARVSRPAAVAACRASEAELATGSLRPRVIHVVAPAAAEWLGRAPGVTCGVLDGASVCVAGAPEDRFRAALAGSRVE